MFCAIIVGPVLPRRSTGLFPFGRRRRVQPRPERPFMPAPHAEDAGEIGRARTTTRGALGYLARSPRKRPRPHLARRYRMRFRRRAHCVAHWGKGGTTSGVCALHGPGPARVTVHRSYCVSAERSGRSRGRVRVCAWDWEVHAGVRGSSLVYLSLIHI